MSEQVVLDYALLDPGIKETVRFLRQLGFRTTDSGDGVTKPSEGDTGALTFPHVFMMVEPKKAHQEADRLKWVLDKHGLLFGEVLIEATYLPIDKLAILMVNFLDDAKLLKRGIPSEEELRSRKTG